MSDKDLKLNKDFFSNIKSTNEYYKDSIDLPDCIRIKNHYDNCLKYDINSFCVDVKKKLDDCLKRFNKI